jgi:hypothetical protein
MIYFFVKDQYLNPHGITLTFEKVANKKSQKWKNKALKIYINVGLPVFPFT